MIDDEKNKEIEELRNYLKDKFSDLEFEERYHKYKVKGTECTSVTTFLGSFSQPFNEHIMAPLVAKKFNKLNPDKKRRSAEWYKRYWRSKRDEAAARGTRVHQFAEMYPDFSNASCNQEKGVLEWFENLPDNYIILFSEFKVYDLNTKKAGTMDLLLYNLNTGKLVIVDWKTNSSSILQHYGSKKLKKPFNNLYSNNISKYRLQLSHYQYILEKNSKLKVEDRWIVWLKEGDYQLVDEEKNDNDKYKVEMLNADVEGLYYKQFNVESYLKEFTDLFDNKIEISDDEEINITFKKKISETEKKIKNAKNKVKSKANYKKK